MRRPILDWDYDPRGPHDLWFPVTAPYLKLGAVQQEDGKGLTLFAVNRRLDEGMPLDIVTDGLGALRFATLCNCTIPTSRR